jgi:hypothetical protein
MDRALAAARAEAERLQSGPRADPLTRGRDETAFVRIVRETQGCDPAVAAVGRSGAMRGLGISRLIDDSLRDGDQGCAIRLAPIMLERWQDPSLNEPDQDRIRFRAGAFLDSARRPEGRRVMAEAEDRLRSGGHITDLWDARINAVAAYSDGPALRPYLSYVANRIVHEQRRPSSQQYAVFLKIFVRTGGCDLVAEVDPRPETCRDAKEWLERAGGRPAPEGFGQSPDRYPDAPSPFLDESGLAAAIAAPGFFDPRRMEKLLAFIKACRRALEARPPAPRGRRR